MFQPLTLNSDGSLGDPVGWETRGERGSSGESHKKQIDPEAQPPSGGEEEGVVWGTHRGTEFLKVSEVTLPILCILVTVFLFCVNLSNFRMICELKGEEFLQLLFLSQWSLWFTFIDVNRAILNNMTFSTSYLCRTSALPVIKKQTNKQTKSPSVLRTLRNSWISCRTTVNFSMDPFVWPYLPLPESYFQRILHYHWSPPRATHRSHVLWLCTTFGGTKGAPESFLLLLNSKTIQVETEVGTIAWCHSASKIGLYSDIPCGNNWCFLAASFLWAQACSVGAVLKLKKWKKAGDVVQW